MRRAVLSVRVHAVAIAALWFGDGFSRGELPVVAAAGKVWETPVLVVPAPPRAMVAARVLRSRQAATPVNATTVAVPDELPVPEDLLADASIGPAGVGEACGGAGCGGVDDVGVGTIGVDIAGMAAAPDPPRLIRVGGDVRAPVKLRQVDPLYPAIARAARVQGTVVVECVIDPHGNVTDTRVVSGPQLLQRAAVEAVQQWRYTPTLLSGVPVAVLMSVTVKFTLN
jgi:periplasmic protein TonB